MPYQIKKITSPVFNCEYCDNEFKVVACWNEHTMCQRCGESGEDIWGDPCNCNSQIVVRV